MNNILIDGEIEYTLIDTHPTSEIFVKIRAGRIRLSFSIRGEEMESLKQSIVNDEYVQSKVIAKVFQIFPTSFKQAKPSKYLTFTADNLKLGI